MTDRYDVNAWIETYKETFASFSKAQQDGFKALERFARFHYAVAGDCLEASLAQAKAALTARAAVGTQAVADLLTRQAELSTRLSEKLRALASQETAGNSASDAANRATGAKKAA